MRTPTKYKRAYSLIEMILYVAILSFMLVVITNIVVSIVRSEHLIRATKSAENSAIFGLDRIVEEIRAAKSVDVASSSFDTDPGTLSLNSTDSSGNARTVEFHVSSGALHIKENGVDMGSLSEASSTVTGLTFSHMTSSSSEAVRTQITVESGTSTYYKIEKFYSTTILRQSI